MEGGQAKPRRKYQHGKGNWGHRDEDCRVKERGDSNLAGLNCSALPFGFVAGNKMKDAPKPLRKRAFLFPPRQA